MESGFTQKEEVDMAQTVQDMDKENKSTIFSRLNPAKFEHFKPLSVYSRMITCDQKANQSPFCNPFINFKVELLNNCEKKRKLDDSSLNETPVKKAFNSEALSPDLGCFMDSSSLLARQDPESPFAPSRQTVSSQQRSEHVECGSSTESGDNRGTIPDRALFNTIPAFDCDVDDILCLHPSGNFTDEGLSDNVEDFKSPRNNIFQIKPDIIPTVAHRQDLGRGDGQVEENAEEDKGFFSMSYIKDLKTGKDPSRSVLAQTTSSPLIKLGEVKAPEDECHLGSSPEPSCHKQAALSEQRVSFTVNDLCPIVSGSLLESVKCPVELLEGDVEEVWNIGLPIFESSVCHNVTVKLNAGTEHSREVSEKVQGATAEPIRECQATLSGGETTLDTSYETTLLQVQVKSVVVAPHLKPSSSKPAAPPLPKQTVKCVSSARSQRPVIFDREEDLEREKRAYIHSVTKHMNEKPGASQDVMSELLNLMTNVADQAPGRNGKQWQHPSDLTRRNYQRRFGNTTPTMTLHEWQAENSPTHRRFAKVPKIFQRSPIP